MTTVSVTQKCSTCVTDQSSRNSQSHALTSPPPNFAIWWTK